MDLLPILELAKHYDFYGLLLFVRNLWRYMDVLALTIGISMDFRPRIGVKDARNRLETSGRRSSRFLVLFYHSMILWCLTTKSWNEPPKGPKVRPLMRESDLINSCSKNMLSPVAMVEAANSCI
jgi:hypothetical protein